MLRDEAVKVKLLRNSGWGGQSRPELAFQPALGPQKPPIDKIMRRRGGLLPREGDERPANKPAGRTRV